MLSVFSSCDPLTKTRLFQSFCLSLYGSALWKTSSPQLRYLETTFNNIIRKIWTLPRRCHTSILHLVSGLHSLSNVVIERSRQVVLQALKTSGLLAEVFAESLSLAYTSFGYNQMYGSRHWNTYMEVDCLCANFIRDARLFPELNSHLEHDIQSMSSTWLNLTIYHKYYTYFILLYICWLHLQWCVNQYNNYTLSRKKISIYINK